MNWQTLIIGLRKELGLSHERLAYEICVGRRSVGRYEAGERKPDERVRKKVLGFIKNNNLDIVKLQMLGGLNLKEVEKRVKSEILQLKKSKDLAELIGIILGDGEIRKDGTIRISFDPKKDKNFLYRRVFMLVKLVLGNKIYFESEKRIAFGHKGFARFLEHECGLRPGSKFENNWDIPKWFFEDEAYLTSVLRGLFDTDGYFGHFGGSIEVMYGRFSDRCKALVRGVENALGILGINCSIQHTKDGRYKIRLSSQRNIIKFFSTVGSSNIKHIVRFLLWRIARYEARIEIEGMRKVCRKLNKLINIKTSRIHIPFIWVSDGGMFDAYIKEDEAFLKSDKPWSRKRKLRL
ncbi:MAG: helix-turn-helix domain-containing protein [Candidatus Aenigmarchaeota archaeon]|nr:helix-turn-helix domain-containing protein [Candidatus Aenigmarchaeota archaeon]